METVKTDRVNWMKIWAFQGINHQVKIRIGFTPKTKMRKERDILVPSFSFSHSYALSFLSLQSSRGHQLQGSRWKYYPLLLLIDAHKSQHDLLLKLANWNHIQVDLGIRFREINEENKGENNKRKKKWWVSQIGSLHLFSHNHVSRIRRENTEERIDFFFSPRIVIWYEPVERVNTVNIIPLVFPYMPLPSCWLFLCLSFCCCTCERPTPISHSSNSLSSRVDEAIKKLIKGDPL